MTKYSNWEWTKIEIKQILQKITELNFIELTYEIQSFYNQITPSHGTQQTSPHTLELQILTLLQNPHT